MIDRAAGAHDAAGEAGWRVGVVIPARNESERISDCLHSIGSAARAARVARRWSDVEVDVVVVADGCTDDTAAIAARELGTRGSVVAAELGCAGAARARGVAHVIGRAVHHPARLWLANTDADTVVPADWITRQLAWASSGVAAVTGIVDIAPDDARLRARFVATYERRDDGTHPHVHGANLGVRGDAYLAVGGWAPIHTGEDHDLWNRVGTAGFTRVADDSLCVLTSARRVGRAPNGFARGVDRLASALTEAAE